MREKKVPSHLKGLEAIKWVQENQAIIKQFKKAEMKQADASVFSGSFTSPFREANKEMNDLADGVLNKQLVINSCYWYDSHGDVHIPGIWNKAVKEAKGVYLLNEHKSNFDEVITDEVIPYVKNVAWRELGININGETECLIFDSKIYPISQLTGKETRRYIAYKNGKVKQHSVGMFYVSFDLAIKHRSDEWKHENATWDKHIDLIANKDEAIEDGMFWAVTQAKIKEGSAVLFGSNRVTPTLAGNKDTDNQPPFGTDDQPSKTESTIFNQILKTLK